MDLNELLQKFDWDSGFHFPFPHDEQQGLYVKMYVKIL